MSLEDEINEIIDAYYKSDFRNTIERTARGATPNYCADLNAIYEVEVFMETNNPELHNDYERELNSTNWKYETLVIPAWQKAEALVRVLGKWKDAFEAISKNKVWAKPQSKYVAVDLFWPKRARLYKNLN